MNICSSMGARGWMARPGSFVLNNGLCLVLIILMGVLQAGMECSSGCLRLVFCLQSAVMAFRGDSRVYDICVHAASRCPPRQGLLSLGL